jgi:hypothetical protein
VTLRGLGEADEAAIGPGDLDAVAAVDRAHRGARLVDLIVRKVGVRLPALGCGGAKVRLGGRLEFLPALDVGVHFLDARDGRVVLRLLVRGQSPARLVGGVEQRLGLG